eukprot:CAMPEP_0178441336 /NCGR_PEP_ID=MMETSP0689_2-20121128/37414_1 /TAXON_ID=160604 /ORGANISM="Amphidinium massartii, Strain CS-259" /LENGTH=272 /DNA_ID=CAMNT_0020064483 /DNA_START=43 /DNA_END=858 /DNA_ORIENTATION=-
MARPPVCSRSKAALLPALLVASIVVAWPAAFTASHVKGARQNAARQGSVAAAPSLTTSSLVSSRQLSALQGTVTSGPRTKIHRLATEGDDSAGRSSLVQAYGVLGVVAYLSAGVTRVVPIVLEGIPSSLEEPWQWALLAACLLFFAYVEGYRGFQLGFSPRVVSRAWVVSEDAADAPLWHKALAPFFCIGYFHGTLRRVVASWGVTSVIFAVVIGVKQLANPYRAIIDAGVVVGLVWGIISILVIFFQTLSSGKPPEFDPALPEDTPYTAPP